jgi:hypothetical protein
MQESERPNYLYSIGFGSTYFRKVNKQEKFVVDYSLKDGNKFLTGCHVHEDKILVTRPWKEHGTNLVSLKEETSHRILA